MVDGAIASSSTITLAAGEGIDFKGKDAGQPITIGVEMEEGPGVEGAEIETISVAEKEAEKSPHADKSEGPGNAGDV